MPVGNTARAGENANPDKDVTIGKHVPVDKDLLADKHFPVDKHVPVDRQFLRRTSARKTPSRSKPCWLNVSVTMHLRLGLSIGIKTASLQSASPWGNTHGQVPLLPALRKTLWRHTLLALHLPSLFGVAQIIPEICRNHAMQIKKTVQSFTDTENKRTRNTPAKKRH